MAEKKEKKYIIENSALMAEWNYEKNAEINLFPNKVSFGSKIKAWWTCPVCKNDYQCRISHKVAGIGCSVCAGKTVIVGYNDFLSTAPQEILAYWDYEKNNILPTELTAGSSKKVWWFCDRGHSYLQSPAEKKYKIGCPKCNKERSTSFPEQAILYYVSKLDEVEGRFLLNKKVEIDIYIPSKKIGIEYDGKLYHSSIEALEKEKTKDTYIESFGIKLIRVKETEKEVDIFDNLLRYVPNGHKSLDNVINCLLLLIGYPKSVVDALNVDTKRDGSTIMSNYLFREKKNSLEALFPELMQEWDFSKNGHLLPSAISANSTKAVWWKCKKCGNSYSMIVSNKTSRHNGCPYCCGKKVKVHYNDLATTNPELLGEWDYEKNTISPTEITKGTAKKAWWICSKGHSYEYSIAKRVNGQGCPICSNRSVAKGVNDLLTVNPHLANEWNYSKNDFLPEEIIAGTPLKVWWICSVCGNEWEATIKSRNSGCGCPACNAPKIRKIMCIETGEIFNSAHSAAQCCGTYPIHILDCCKGKRKTAGGFHWQYAK